MANFIDGAIYLAEGDYFGVALCFVNGLTMGATAAASALLKTGKLCKVADVTLRVAMVSERIAGGLSFAQNAYNIGNTGIQMYCKYGIMGESIGWDTAGEVLSLGLSAMGCASGLKSMGTTSPELLELKELAARGGLCFVAGTKVKTSDGDKNIEDIAIGDEVYAYDAETGETGSKHVIQTFINEASELAHVTIDGETIDATPTHPFYVAGYGFKPAGELLAGEKILLLNGETKEIEDVTIEHLDEPVKVYNFEVEDWHTYYVTEHGVLVHNMCLVTNQGGSGAKALVDSAQEPEVQNFIQRFKERYPGREYKSGHKVQHSDGRIIEIDFETDNAILEFKRGNGKGLTRQIIDRQDSIINPMQKVVIGVPGSKMSRFVQQDVEKAGGLMSNDIELILDLIKPD